MHYGYLVIYIRGFLSPMESILIENGNSDNVEISRGIIMKTVLAQLKGVIELELEQDVNDFYHDWNYPNNTGIIVVEFQSENKEYDNKSDHIPEYGALIEEVQRISYLVQKVPETTEAIRISPKIYLVKRTGLLVQIEKALIAKGFHETLIVTKDQLEKSHFHRSGRFQEIFQQEVGDIFVDWNLHEDKSMMCFILK